jgi:hypothetical protein
MADPAGGFGVVNQGRGRKGEEPHRPVRLARRTPLPVSGPLGRRHRMRSVPIAATTRRPTGSTEVGRPTVRLPVDLIQPGGIGVIGPGANGYMRALLVELLAREEAPLRVIMSRNEVNRLFEGDFDDALITAFDSRLFVTDLLEDAVEHLELDLLVSNGEKADHLPGDPAATFWIATLPYRFD